MNTPDSERSEDPFDLDQARKGDRWYARIVVNRLNLPASAPLEGGEQYAMLAALGGAILAAERGEETELIRPDGRVAARIVPS